MAESNKILKLKSNDQGNQKRQKILNCKTLRSEMLCISHREIIYVFIKINCKEAKN